MEFIIFILVLSPIFTILFTLLLPHIRGKDGFNIFGYDKHGFNRSGYDKFGYNKDGFDKHGFNEKGFDKKGLDSEGYDVKGFDKKGFNRNGYDKFGYNKDGFDHQGFDTAGFNKFGFNSKGFNKQGFNQKGYNIQGFDINGFNNQGYNKDGYDSKGYNAKGYNILGFNAVGRNSNGIPWWFIGLKDISYYSNPNFHTYYVTVAKKEKINNVTTENIGKKMAKSDLSLYNPYNLLGLDIKSKVKDINRRSNEIIKLLNINSIINLPNTIFQSSIIRNEALVKEASIKLMNAKEKIPFLFFWFDIPNEEIKKLIFESFPQIVLYQLLRLYKLNNDLFSLKLAISYSVSYGLITQDTLPIKLTMEYWKDVIKDKNVWEQLSKIYQETLEVDSKLDPVLSFKQEIITHLSEFYYQIYEVFNDQTILMKFFEIFQTHSKKTIQILLYPLLNDFNSKLKTIDEYKPIFSNESLDYTSKEKIKKLLNEMNLLTKAMIDFHFNGESEVKEVFEKFSSKVRSLGINILNGVKPGSSDFDFGKSILTTALSMTDSVVMKDRIKKDFDDIERANKKTKLLEAIRLDFKNHNYEQSRSKIDNLKLLESSYEHSKFCNSLILTSYKNEYIHVFESSMEKANALANNPYAYDRRSSVINYVSEAIGALDNLIYIAEKEGDTLEKMRMNQVRDNLVSQIRRL